MRRVQLLRSSIKSKAITYNWHDPQTSFIEAVLSRGDRRLGAVIEDVWLNGGKLDSWGEHFSFDRCQESFKRCHIDPSYYANREIGEEEILPWSITSTGVKDEYLLSERHTAQRGEITPDCRRQCTQCGASELYTGGVCDE